MAEEGRSETIDALEETNKLLLETASCKLAIVPVEQFDLLEKNSRFMRNEMFKNLVSNIQRMGFQQLPFCVKIGDRYKVLSGNHRVRAGIEAGKTHLPTLYTDAELTNDEQIAIQLSHNAISGQDDPTILAELWASLENVDMKYFSGLDDKQMMALQKVSMPPLSEMRIEYRGVTFMFLPNEIDRALALFDLALKTVQTDDIFLARVSEFDRVMDALAKTSAAFRVKNTATALSLILDVFEKHYEDLKAGWVEAPKGDIVPLASIFGSDMIPFKTAKKIQKAIETMISRGESDGRDLHKLLEKWADTELAKPVE